MFLKINAFFSHLLILSFLITPSAQAKSVSEMESALIKYQTYRYFKDITAETDMKSASPFEKELVDFIKKEGLMDQTLVPAELQGNSWVFKGNDQKDKISLSFAPSTNEFNSVKKMILKVNNQVVSIDSTLSMQEMLNKILPLIGAKKVSWFNFIVDDAEAQNYLLFTASIAAVVASILSVFALIMNFLDAHSFKVANDTLLEFESHCRKDASSISKPQQEELKKLAKSALVRIDEIYRNGCVAFTYGNWGKQKVERDNACENTLPRVKACIEKIIEASITNDDSGRSKVKDVDPSKGKPTSTVKAKTL